MALHKITKEYVENQYKSAQVVFHIITPLIMIAKLCWSVQNSF